MPSRAVVGDLPAGQLPLDHQVGVEQDVAVAEGRAWRCSPRSRARCPGVASRAARRCGHGCRRAGRACRRPAPGPARPAPGRGLRGIGSSAGSTAARACGGRGTAGCRAGSGRSTGSPYAAGQLGGAGRGGGQRDLLPDQRPEGQLRRVDRARHPQAGPGRHQPAQAASRPAQVGGDGRGSARRRRTAGRSPPAASSRSAAGGPRAWPAATRPVQTSSIMPGPWGRRDGPGVALPARRRPRTPPPRRCVRRPRKPSRPGAVERPASTRDLEGLLAISVIGRLAAQRADRVVASLLDRSGGPSRTARASASQGSSRSRNACLSTGQREQVAQHVLPQRARPCRPTRPRSAEISSAAAR